ncbi:hypothetical protein [Vibrio cincinnatiensis]|uniref:hypothetical protein n=1 Tax=Vibrio cincinnatiensis TaxID=675 RepID=UPI001EDCB6E1|nr:hypothetical protein [Vibrio cincinnatiensis]MCG3727411.1 hypothetical protein [Vibrio cincinnatiensis]
MELSWSKSHQISELLDNVLTVDFEWPPESNGVYVVSLLPWDSQPDADSVPLYFGSTTGRSARFCTRIGDLLADMFGFFGENTGHHSGGQSLYWWCQENQVNPKNLYLGWAEFSASGCSRCAEIFVANMLVPHWKEKGDTNLLNKNRPPKCETHNTSV